MIEAEVKSIVKRCYWDSFKSMSDLKLLKKGVEYAPDRRGKAEVDLFKGGEARLQQNSSELGWTLRTPPGPKGHLRVFEEKGKERKERKLATAEFTFGFMAEPLRLHKWAQRNRRQGGSIRT